MSAEPILPTRVTPKSSAAVLERIRGMLSRTVSGLAREWRVRRDLGRLREFDDAMLHDIGLARSGIEHTVRHGRPSRDVTALRAQPALTARPGPRNIKETSGAKHALLKLKHPEA